MGIMKKIKAGFQGRRLTAKDHEPKKKDLKKKPVPPPEKEEAEEPETTTDTKPSEGDQE